MAKADKPVAGVRVGVKNGGCAGMAYTMEYAEDVANPTDEVVEDKGVQDPDRSQGGAVPARHRDGLQDRQAVVAVRVQQSEPDLGLRLRRIRALDAGRRASSAPRRTDERRGAWRRDPLISPSCSPPSARSTVRRMFGGAGIFADGVMFAPGRGRRDLSQGRRRQRSRRSSAKGSRRSRYAPRHGRACRDVVLADAGAALRRSGRTGALGAAA